MSSTSESGEDDIYKSVKSIEMDADGGTFKYIVVELLSCMGVKKLILRGSKRFEYHTDIFDHVMEEVKKCCGDDTRFKVMGGGRITHDPVNKTIRLFGYSQAFGSEERKQTIKLLSEFYPDYAKIDCSNDSC